MKIDISRRGYRAIKHYEYISEIEAPITFESSAIGNYDDSMEYPGSSYLWIKDFHLNRDDIKQLIWAMQHWLDHKRLPESFDSYAP